MDTNLPAKIHFIRGKGWLVFTVEKHNGYQVHSTRPATPSEIEAANMGKIKKVYLTQGEGQ